MVDKTKLDDYKKKLQDILELVEKIKGGIEPLLKQEEAAAYSKKGIRGMIYNENDPEHTEDTLIVTQEQYRNMLERNEKWRLIKSRTRDALRKLDYEGPSNSNVIYVTFR